MNAIDYPIEKTIVSEETKGSTRREVIMNVIYVDKEEQRTKDSSLRHSREYLTGFRDRTVYNNVLETVFQERRHPVVKGPLNAHRVHHRKENFVVDFVKGFRKVKKDCVSLTRGVKGFRKIVESGEEL